MNFTKEKRKYYLILLLMIFGFGCSQRGDFSENSNGERVISLAPNITEIICAIGAQELLVGRTSACDYPSEITEKTPVIGGFGVPSLDSLLRAKPTIVLDVDLEDERMGKMIAQLGIRRERIKCSNLDNIPSAIITIGALLNHKEKAETLANSITKKVMEIRAVLETDDKTERPLVYAEIWGDPPMTVGRGSYISELIELAGGRNIGDSVSDRDYFTVSSEWIIANDPEVIICLYMSDSGTIKNAIAGRTGWQGISAVKNERVYGGLDSSLVLRPGPRVLEGIEMLRKHIECNK